MASLIKRKGRPNWIAQYMTADGKRRERSTRTRDKRAAELIAAQWERGEFLVKSGLITAGESRRAAAAREPLEVHLAAFEASIRARGRTDKHVADTLHQVRRVAAAADIGSIVELVPSKVDVALRALQESGASVRTVNKARTAAKAFSRWLSADGRLGADELRGLANQDARVDPRVRRRALDAEEARALITAAEGSAVVLRGLTGRDRSMLYRIAIYTGLRAGEIASLTPESFAAEGGRHSVRVVAGRAKNRREAVLPLAPAVARELAPWLLSRPAREPVFPVRRLSDVTAWMLRRDLAAAEIPERDDEGRVVDFHALRHTFLTLLARSGAPLVVAQRLARHSTPDLTANWYTHLRMADLESAVAEIAAPGDAEEAAATTSKNASRGVSDGA